MSTAQSLNSLSEFAQPHSSVDALDLQQSHADFSESERHCLATFLDQLIRQDVLNARISGNNNELRYQLKKLNGVEEYREQSSDLLNALSAVSALCSNPDKRSDEYHNVTLTVRTNNHDLDITCVHLESAHGDQWVLRAREVDPVPKVLDTLGLSGDELRHVRKALNEPRGLVSIGTPNRRHLEDWQRAVSRELCAPDRNILSLAPRILEDFPGITQAVLPAGERWDKKLWQLAGAMEAEVIVLCDDGTHGFAPDQLGVLADRCLVIQILQTPNIKALAKRTPTGSSVHRVIMHHPVRQLCKSCCEPHNNPSRLEYGFLDRALPTLSDGVNAWLSASQSTHFKKPRGCDNCAMEGYSGELSVVDSVGEPTTLNNVAELLDDGAIVASRSSKLVDLAGRGEVCLDEWKRLLSP